MIQATNNMDAQEIQMASEAQYRSLAIVWLVVAVSQAFFFGVTLIVPNDNDRFLSMLRWPMAVLGLLFVFDSFLWKHKFLLRAASQHKPSEVTRAYILACCLSEATALFGFLLRFGAFPYYYVLFAVAALAAVVHFPRRRDVLASYESL